MIVWDPNENAPGLDAVLAEKLAKLLPAPLGLFVDEVPKENVGAAFVPATGVEEPKAGVEAGLDEPNVKPVPVVGVDEAKPPNAGVVEVVPNENAGVAGFAALVEEDAPSPAGVVAAGLAVEEPKLTGFPPKVNPV